MPRRKWSDIEESDASQTYNTFKHRGWTYNRYNDGASDVYPTSPDAPTIRVVRGSQGHFDDGWYIASWENVITVDQLKPAYGPYPTLKTAKIAYLIVS